MPEPASHRDVHDSYARCSTNVAFFDDFYHIFLNSSPKIAPHFANTDFSKQKQLLRQGIAMLLMFTQGATIAHLALDRLAASHSYQGHNITGDLYDLWLDSLILALKKHDPKFSPELEAAWREVAAPGINYIQKHYDMDIEPCWKAPIS